MPRNVSGTYSTTAGEPVVSNTVISSVTFNNLVADLAAEITDSLSRSGKGGMTSPLRTADGAVAAPAHSFTSETGSGLYRIGDGDVGFAIKGNKRLEILATGVLVPDALVVGGAINPLGNIAKSGSALSVGTSDANEVQIVRSGAVVLATTATSLDAKSRPIINVTDPINAQDAATKNFVVAGPAFTGKPTAPATAGGDAATTLTTKGYVDPLVQGIKWALLTCGAAGAVTVTAGSGVASASYAAAVLTVVWSVAYSGATSYAVTATNVSNATPMAFLVGGAAQVAGQCAFGSYALSTGNGRNWASGDIITVFAIGT